MITRATARAGGAMFGSPSRRLQRAARADRDTLPSGTTHPAHWLRTVFSH